MGGCCCGARKSEGGARDTSEILYFRSEDSELFLSPGTGRLRRRQPNCEMPAKDLAYNEQLTSMTCDQNGISEIDQEIRIIDSASMIHDISPAKSNKIKEGSPNPCQRRSSLEPVILNEEFGESSYLWLGVQNDDASYEEEGSHTEIEVFLPDDGCSALVHNDRFPNPHEFSVDPLDSIELEYAPSWGQTHENIAEVTSGISHSLTIEDQHEFKTITNYTTGGFKHRPFTTLQEGQHLDGNCQLQISDAPFLACVTMISDPVTNKQHFVTAALRKGLLDYETAAVLLEGQIQAGGIVHISQSRAVEIPCLRLVAVEEALTHDLIDKRMYGRLKAFEDTVKDVVHRALRGQCPYDCTSDTQMRMVQLQTNVGGILDFTTLDLVPMSEGVQRQIIEDDVAKEIIYKQIVSGGVIKGSPFARLSLAEAIDSGLIPMEYAKESKQFEQLYNGILDPDTSENTTYAMCVRRGILSRKTIVEFLIKQAVEHGGWIRNCFSNEWLPITRAMHEGVVDVDMWEAVEQAVVQNKHESTLIHPMWLRPVSYFDFLTSANFDDAMQCKVVAACNMFDGVYDSRHNESVSICEAFKRDLKDRETAKRLLKAQMESGGLVDIIRKERIPVSKALSRQIVDFPMAVSLIQQIEVSLF